MLFYVRRCPNLPSRSPFQRFDATSARSRSSPSYRPAKTMSGAPECGRRARRPGGIPVSASLGPRNDNLANVAWSGSLRIHVDVHNQALLLRRLIELPVAGPVEQRHCRVILDILAGA
jgi:hypothetical protein